MDSILVVGTDTVVGANLAAYWAGSGRTVTGWSRPATATDVAADDLPSGPTPLQAARKVVTDAAPTQILFCGAASESAWFAPNVTVADENHLRVWARAARESGCGFTYISSDAVFSGPWIFHGEESSHHCESESGLRLRSMEELLQRVMPEALIVRTHVFGWSPAGDAGAVETLLRQLRTGEADADPIPHASPMLATDLAEILDRAHEEHLSGVLHIAGAERVSRAAFAQQLADHFDLPAPPTTMRQTLEAPARGFGRSETALLTRRAKQTLNLAMPMLADGLERLATQSLTGFRDRVCGGHTALQRAA